MGWLILIAYLIGVLLTWVVAYALLHKDFSEDKYTGPLEAILMAGFISMIMSWVWPIIIAIFGIHRIATRRVGDGDG